MAVPKRVDRMLHRLCLLGLGPLLAAGSASGAAVAPALSTENINLSADLLNSDARNDVHVMTGNVRITQGDMSMQAEEATVNGLQTDHSHWKFERDVHIRTDAADLKSSTADAVFAGGRIAEATIHGSPATFDQLNAATADKNVHGRAQVIEYDFAKGTVKMTQDVWFSYGGNEFRGDTLIYSLVNERVVVNPGGNSASGGRVNITIKPGTSLKLPGSESKPKPPDQPDQSDRGGNTE